MASTGAAADGLPRWLPVPLREPRNAWQSIGVGWLLTFGGSLLLSILASKLAPDLRRPEFPMSGAQAFFLLVIFSPLVETLIMAGVLTLLLRLVPPAAAIAISSVGWGMAHSLAAPAWGLIIWWPFLILSTLYVAWRPRGWGWAIAIPALTHALQNLPPTLLIMSGVKV